MAVQEINAAGGVLGRSLQMFTFNSNNGRAAVQRAMERDVFALLGPVTAEQVRMAAPVARAAGLVHIVGADAPDLAMAGGSVFRAAPGPTVRLPRLAAWLHDELGARRLSLVWSNTEFGRGKRDALTRELRTHGLELAAEHTVVPVPAGYGAEVAAVARAAPDAVVVMLPAAECVRFLQEARRQALRTPLVGESTLAAPRVLAQAGAAAEGVRCQLGFAAAPEVAPFSARFAELFKQEPDDATVMGYTAVGMLAGGVARLGRVDRAGLAGALRGLTLRAGAPAMLLDSSWDPGGEMHRATFMVEVRDGHAVVLRTLGGTA